MEEEFYGASGTDPRSIAGMGVLNSLSGGRGDLVQQYVNEAVPLPKKADPYVAALKFFIEMGKQASQPGATVLGSITGSMGAPVDYLEAKALERQKAEQARSALGLQIAPSLKPGGGKVTYRPATPDELKVYGKTSGQMGSDGKFYDLSPTGSDTNNQLVQSSTILDDGTVVTVLKDGTRLVRNALGEKVEGQIAADAIREAQAYGSDIQGERAGSRRAATVSVDAALKAFESVNDITINIANLEEAKRLVVQEGANTGVIADLLPNWTASSIALNNVKNRLGLDVVGSVTFGALSASELDLALNTALPTNLSETALADWLNSKIIAQRKLSSYLQKQATFLADGDKTIGDWLRTQQAQSEASDTDVARINGMSQSELNGLTDDDLANLSVAGLQAYLLKMGQ
jgi:hypothetical protein